MNAAALLALIADLYAQITLAQDRIKALEARLSEEAVTERNADHL